MGKRYSKYYYAMMKKYKKQLNQISKETTPWDYGHIEKFVVTSLKFMLEYYTNGENVWGLDNPEDPKRIAILKELVMLWKKYVYFYDRNYKLAEKFYKDFWTKLGENLHYLWD